MRWCRSLWLGATMAWITASGTVSQEAAAALVPCPLASGVATCQVGDGDSVLEVRATSLSGGAVSTVLRIGGVADLPFETFKVYSFDVDDFIDVVVESAMQDAAARQIRVQVREVESSAIRAVGVVTLDDTGPSSIIEETITFTNLLAVPVNGRFYVITDLDLNGDAPDDTIAVSLAGTRIEQADGTTRAVIETTGDPPDAWDVAPCCDLSDIATGPVYRSLDDRTSVPGPADFQAAWSWDRQIGVGKSAVAAVRKTVTVPEPIAAATSAASLAALLAIGSRRRGSLG